MYQPKGSAPSDAAGLAAYVNGELQSVAQAQSDAQDCITLNLLAVAPKKPREGMICFANGTTWNPAAGGKGVYVYSGGAWVKF